jgi:hypothetical protein
MPYFGPRDALDDAEMGYQSSAEDPFCLAAAHCSRQQLRLFNETGGEAYFALANEWRLGRALRSFPKQPV